MDQPISRHDSLIRERGREQSEGGNGCVRVRVLYGYPAGRCSRLSAETLGRPRQRR